MSRSRLPSKSVNQDVSRATYGRGMLRALNLLIPALIPSWRFFKSVQPSPRVEWAFLADPDQIVREWIPYRPRQKKFTLFKMLLRVFWNPSWNQSLYLVSLAERLMAEPTEHSIQQIHAYIAMRIPQEQRHGFQQFRLIFVYRDGTNIRRETTYQSQSQRIEDCLQ